MVLDVGAQIGKIIPYFLAERGQDALLIIDIYSRGRSLSGVEG